MRFFKFLKVLCLLLIISLSSCGCVSGIHSFITSEPITVGGPLNVYTNDYQSNASVQMTSFNGKLFIYFCDRSIKGLDNYTNWLCVFDEGDLLKVKHLDQILTARNGMIYHVTKSDSTKPEQHVKKLELYQIATKENERLLDVESFSNRRCYWDGDVFFYPADNNCEKYYAIQKDVVLPDFAFPKEFRIENTVYKSLYKKVLCIDDLGNEYELVDLLPYGREQTLIPYKDGLIVHNEYQGNLLYFINDQNELIELFHVPCLHATSAIAVYNDYVYCSFVRYEKYGEIGMLRYENDQVEGTYRINMNDYSVEKISDKIYNGLFILDDTGIFACNSECDIVKLDFDGKVQFVLLD